MRTSLAPQPHLYMGDMQGRPLDAGKVYFGEPNKDPELYPIDVYYDEALTIAAPQPIRTMGGFMNANGQMIEIYAAEIMYSVKVLDGYSRQVFYQPSMSRVTQGEGINTQIFYSDAVLRPLNDKLSDYASINDLPSADTLNKDLKVDLLGKSIAMPNEQNQYVNGYVEKSDHLVWRGNHQTPFGKANIKPIISDFNGHFGFNSGIVDVSYDTHSRWVCAYRRGPKHGATKGAQIWAADSLDFGQTWINHRVIYARADADTRNFVFGKMGNERIGLTATVMNEDGSYKDAVFIYSDTRGQTWSSVSIATGSAKVNFHGSLMKYPASVGGHDTTGYISYAYSHNGGITAVYTVNNGLTWAIKHNAANTDPTGTVVENLSECAAVRVGTQDKWVMVARNSFSSSKPKYDETNAVAWTSIDMLNWSPPVNTGLPLKKSPPQLIYDWGRVWFIGFSRSGSQLVNGHTGHLVMASMNGDDLFESGGVFTGKKWEVVTQVPEWNTGYIHPFKIKDRWYASFVSNEDEGTRSILYMIGDFTPVSVSVQDVIKLSPRESLNANGCMQLWGSSNTATATNQAPVECADNWYVAAAPSETSTGSKTANDDSFYALHPVPENVLRVRGTAATAGTHYIQTKVYGLKGLTEKLITLSFWLKGDTTGTKSEINKIGLFARYGTGSTSSADSLAHPTLEENLPFSGTWRKYEHTFNTNIFAGRDIKNDAYLDVNIYLPDGTYDIYLANVKLEDSMYATPVVTVPDYIERNRIMSKVEMSATLSSGVINVNRQPSTMICNVSASGASASMTTINGGMLGQQIVLAPASGKTITVSDGVNIKTNGNCVLASVNDQIVLINRGTFWAELSRSVNG